MKTLLIIISGVIFLECYSDSKIEILSTLVTNNNVSNNTDTCLIFSQIKINEESLYTGKGIDNGRVKTNGIQIKRTSDRQIDYIYTQLINWEKEFDDNGVATLLSCSDSLKINDNLTELAYKFRDSINNRIIYITQSKFVNQTYSKVFDLKPNDSSKLMYNKW
jgi:hypothetical protein